MCWTLRSKLSVLRLSPLPFWLEHILAQGTKPIIHSLDTSQMGSSLVHSGVPHGGFLNLSFRCKGGAHTQQKEILTFCQAIFEARRGQVLVPRGKIIHGLDTSQMGSSLVRSGVVRVGFLSLSIRWKGGARIQQNAISM